MGVGGQTPGTFGGVECTWDAGPCLSMITKSDAHQAACACVGCG